MTLEVDLPEGAYREAWVNTLTGKEDGEVGFVHGGGMRELVSPGFVGDVALRIVRKGESL